MVDLYMCDQATNCSPETNCQHADRHGGFTLHRCRERPGFIIGTAQNRSSIIYVDVLEFDSEQTLVLEDATIRFRFATISLSVPRTADGGPDVEANQHADLTVNGLMFRRRTIQQLLDCGVLLVQHLATAYAKAMAPVRHV